ncbi:unnamed protein product [Cyberlindnera jadinii]|uniref:Uncharacterized protein n=1 Tax=Cyberlindnera jadinii (strain ATCC 18201 / CBS 1600 / BCRC 20928 / JCM 3617 / NBRC 0987 / NRRL Y-1542) TaxID=983966 RepID=A0A0H5BZ11_CYBJN|nr:unnamed protein product [Cyberlindnera jadinii]
MPSNRAPPFLELSRDTLQDFDTSGLDLENVLAVWTGLTKCSSFIKNGKRLENISWRIVNRNLVVKQNESSNSDVVEAQSNLGKTRNKLNDGDLFSILSIVSEQGVSSTRPLLTKRRSGSKILTKKSFNRSSESLNRPPVFRKTSSSKSLKKMSLKTQQKRNSALDLTSIPNDIDLFEQPNPRYAFGIYEPSNAQKDEATSKPGLTRSDTSTSVVRGFVPGAASEPEGESLPVNHIQKSKQSSASTTPVESLFKPPAHQTKPEPPKSPVHTTSSLFSKLERVKSPLSHDSTADVLNSKVPESLFNNNHHSNKKKSLTNTDKAQEEHTNTTTSSLFDHAAKLQNAEMSQPKPQLKKRATVLNNLGMTSLSKPQDKKHEKNMFFIESSPSPTDSKFLDSHHHNSGHVHHDKKSPALKPQGDHKSLFSGNGNHTNQNGKSSLFEGKKPIREIMFSSDDSFSDESDWSSVSEDLASEDEQDINEQWKRTVFKREDSKAQKPQIKRSLLSGLFLNEMQSEEAYQQRPQPPLKASTTSVSSKNSSDGYEILSTSAASGIVVKHRSNPLTESNNLERNTAEPVTSISTTHAIASGLLHEPNSSADLKTTLDQQHQPSSSLSHLTKSALHLTNYFSSQRKNSFSSIASDRSRMKFKHESNAPPTASTLLPTALSTHMFLPNAHQRAKSRLTAVAESESNEPSRKTSTDGGIPSKDGETVETEDVNDKNCEVHPQDQVKAVTPIKSPTIHIPIAAQHHEDKHNISRKLSPKTTRKQMLATELSDSLRKSILWDRQYAFTGDGTKKYLYDVTGVPATTTLKDANEGPISEEKWGDNGADKPKVIKKDFQVDDDWDKESFYTRGW